MNNDTTDAVAETDSNVPEWLPTLLVVGALAYVIVGVLWMDSHGTGPQSTLDANSIFQFLAAVFLWPLYLVGLL